MAIQIKSVKGYYFLDAWIMANIIQQSTLHFCNDLLTRENDPCGRLRDQMTMAARSAVANIAEGASRRQTSRETEMRLTDVAAQALANCSAIFTAMPFTITSAHGRKPRGNTPCLIPCNSTAPTMAPTSKPMPTTISAASLPNLKERC